MNLYVIVVTYNGKKWYDRCFGSLLLAQKRSNIIVIDNASVDGSVEYIKAQFPEVYVIESDVNLGFAKANNIGIRYALDHGADYIFLLNQDAWIESDTLTELLCTFEDNDNVGVASPVHLNGSYSALDENFTGYMGVGFASDAFLQKVKHYYEVPFVNAAAWLVSADCVKRVGGFDTLLFKHYGEDDNYLQRVVYHGLKVLVNTHCTICHDREGRTGMPQKFHGKDFVCHVEKVNKGNILRELDVDMEMECKKRELRKAYMGVHPKRVARLKKEIQLLTDIHYSRQCNIKGGLVWL